jgi:hypothetical protein
VAYMRDAGWREIARLVLIAAHQIERPQARVAEGGAFDGMQHSRDSGGSVGLSNQGGTA